MITDADFWQQAPEVRDDQVPLSDTQCLICGRSLQGETFVWDMFMGPQVDIAGMHLQCAYNFGMRTLRDLARTWHLNPSQLREFVDSYDQDRLLRAPRSPDVPAE
jgi:hypothetical protein